MLFCLILKKNINILSIFFSNNNIKNYQNNKLGFFKLYVLVLKKFLK